MLKVGLEGTSRRFELQSFGCCVLTVAVEGSGLRQSFRLRHFEASKYEVYHCAPPPHPPENNQKNFHNKMS